MEFESSRLPILRAALKYAELGFRVFPVHGITTQGCCTCGNYNCKKAGKHPRVEGGFKAATVDPVQIERWFSAMPDSNIGIATGADSKLVVLDIDDKNDGEGSRNLRSLMAEYDWNPKTPKAMSGNGFHLFFRHPGERIPSRAGCPCAGIDSRGDGGFIIVPPSRHANGNDYRWVAPVDAETGIASALADDLLEELPAWLISKLAEARSSDRTGHILEGERNDRLMRYGARLRGQGASRDVIGTALHQKNVAGCRPPLPHDEVEAIATSVSRYSPNRKKPARSRDLHWMKFSLVDFFASSAVRFGCDRHRGWLTSLLVEAWLLGGVIPADEDHLWKIVGAESKEVFSKEAWLVLEEFERSVTDDGEEVFVHSHLAKLHEQSREKCEQMARRKREKANPPSAKNIHVDEDEASDDAESQIVPHEDEGETA